jgi:hypothetical protein
MLRSPTDLRLVVILSLSQIVNIINYADYDVNSFGGSKQVILTTTSSLGREAILGWILIAGAIFSFLFVIILLITKGKSPLYNKQNLDNFENLEW